MRKEKIMQKPQLYFSARKIRIALRGSASPLPDLSGEHILQNDLEFCLDEEDEIYEGYGRCRNAYPYRQYNTYTRDLKDGEVRTAVLENEYLKAVFLPEFGGRLWELKDKTTGENILYTNDVIRFSNLAVRNAWFSGGVEWNIGVIGHTPLTADPLYTAELTNDSGYPVLRMYEYERIRRTVYQMDFWMENDKRLYCRMRIVNGSSEVVPMYWWSNMAVPEYDNGHVIVPADKAFTYKDGKVFKVDLPFVDGTDVTAYKNIPRSVDYFFDIPEETPKYIANVNSEGYGLLHVSTKRLRSRKLFSWGNTSASDHWQEFLTEKAGRYIEIQAGLGKTQYGCLPMAHHTAWEWVECYGPVQLDSGIKEQPAKEKAEWLTRRIQEDRLPEKLEKLRISGKKTAKEPAALVWKGSGFGAMRPYVRGTEHLVFEMQEESLLRWKAFLETGKLGEKEPFEDPGEFCVDRENYSLLEQAVEGKEANNWYAWYLLGIGYYVDDRWSDAAEAFEKSFQLEENPWAAHGAASALLMEGNVQIASSWMEHGLIMKKQELAYLKEGMNLLNRCKAYGTLCGIYEDLDDEMQKNGKLKFLYISALHALGEDEKAYRLLEENGGLVMEDIREGEDSVACLWAELSESVNKKSSGIPYRYDFKAY